MWPWKSRPARRPGPRARLGPRPRRLVREPDDRKIAGVCAGLADRIGVDVSLVRLGAVVLAVFTPVGLIAYLVAWAIVPERRPDEPRGCTPADLPHFGRIPLWLLIVGAVAPRQVTPRQLLVAVVAQRPRLALAARRPRCLAPRPG